MEPLPGLVPLLDPDEAAHIVGEIGEADLHGSACKADGLVNNQKRCFWAANTVSTAERTLEAQPPVNKPFQPSSS